MCVSPLEYIAWTRRGRKRLLQEGLGCRQQHTLRCKTLNRASALEALEQGDQGRAAHPFRVQLLQRGQALVELRQVTLLQRCTNIQSAPRLLGSLCLVST